jgi:hypothetical protein
MQYSSATILLHRPTASFGNPSRASSSPSSLSARQTCVSNACRISHILTDYQTHHGSCITMSGVALHTIATAATTLIANIVESKSQPIDSQFTCLRQCIRSLTQLEKSYLVTRRVRKIIQIIMRLLNLDIGHNTLPLDGLTLSVSGNRHRIERNGSFGSDAPSLMECATMNSVSDDSGMWELPETSPFRVEDFMFPASAQSTQFFLSSFEPVLGRM